MRQEKKNSDFVKSGHEASEFVIYSCLNYFLLSFYLINNHLNTYRMLWVYSAIFSLISKDYIDTVSFTKMGEKQISL